jgi:hypothetical protein
LEDSTTTVPSNLVALYKALGGGWDVDLPEEKTPGSMTRPLKAGRLPSAGGYY